MFYYSLHNYYYYYPSLKLCLVIHETIYSLARSLNIVPQIIFYLRKFVKKKIYYLMGSSFCKKNRFPLKDSWVFAKTTETISTHINC